MKLVKYYSDVKRFVAYTLIPVSLVSSMTSCCLKKVKEEEKYMKTEIFEKERDNQILFQSLEQYVGKLIEIEVTKDIEKKQLFIDITGLEQGQVENQFYLFLNRLIWSAEDYQIFLSLTNYDNQIDFTKIQFLDLIHLSIYDSVDVCLDGIEDQVSDLFIHRSSLDDYEIIRQIGRRKGTLKLNDISTLDTQEIGEILKDNTLSFQRCSMILSSDDFDFVTDMCAEVLDIMIKENTKRKELIIHPDVRVLQISRDKNTSYLEDILNTQICISKDTEISFLKIELLDFKTCLFMSVQNAKAIHIYRPVVGIEEISFDEKKRGNIVTTDNMIAHFIEENHQIVGVSVQESYTSFEHILGNSSIPVGVYYSKENNIRTISIVGYGGEDIIYTEEQFYEAFNHVIALDSTLPLVMELIGYQNQIDFSKIDISLLKAGMEVKLINSQNVDVTNIIHYMNQLTLIGSNVTHLDEVLLCLKEQKGTIVYHENTFLGDIASFLFENPDFSIYRIGFINHEEALQLLPILNANQVFLDLEKIGENHENIQFHEQIPFISLFSVLENMEIMAGDNSRIFISSSDISLNSHVVQSLSNTCSVTIYYDVEGELVVVEITEDDCIVTTPEETYTIPFDYSTDGTKNYLIEQENPILFLS